MALGYADKLLFVAHEEGRARPIRNMSGAIDSFANDYFIKDHLGNVRMMIMEEIRTDPFLLLKMPTKANKTPSGRIVMDSPSM